MSRTKKAAPSTCTGGDGNGQQLRLGGFDNLSDSNFITAFCPKQGSIAALLSKGRGNALTTREISKISGLSPRDVTRAVYDERRHGAPILSDPGAGFWLAETAEELLRCVAALHRRAGEIRQTAEALEQITEEYKDGDI